MISKNLLYKNNSPILPLVLILKEVFYCAPILPYIQVKLPSSPPFRIENKNSSNFVILKLNTKVKT